MGKRIFLPHSSPQTVWKLWHYEGPSACEAGAQWETRLSAGRLWSQWEKTAGSVRGQGTRQRLWNSTEAEPMRIKQEEMAAVPSGKTQQQPSPPKPGNPQKMATPSREHQNGLGNLCHTFLSPLQAHLPMMALWETVVSDK